MQYKTPNYIYENNTLTSKVTISNSRYFNPLSDGPPDSWIYISTKKSYYELLEDKNSFINLENIEIDKPYYFKINKTILERFKALASLDDNEIHQQWNDKYGTLPEFAEVTFALRKSGQFAYKIGDDRGSDDKMFIFRHLLLNKSMMEIDFSDRSINIIFGDNFPFGKTEKREKNIKFKENIWWTQNNKYKGIEKKILSIVMMDNNVVKTADFKGILTNNYLGEKSSKILYSFKDNSGGYFDHMIRNNRNQLEKEGFILRGPHGYSVIKDIPNIDEYRLLLDDFKNDLISPSSINSSVSNSGNNAKINRGKAKSFEDKVSTILNKDRSAISNAKNTSPEEMEKTSVVTSLRTNFKNDIKYEFGKIKDLIGDYAKTFILDNDFEFPDAAHIIPVSYLIKQERWGDIANKNNGLLLDPNTHRLFDKHILKIEKKKDSYFLVDKKELRYKIRDEFINTERRKYLDEYIENFNNKH